MNLTLNELDQAFENLWQHENQMSALIDTWQNLLLEYLTSAEAMKTKYSIIESHLNYWDSALMHRTALPQQSMAETIQ